MCFRARVRLFVDGIRRAQHTVMDAAAATYARDGLVLLESVLSPEDVKLLRIASERRLCEALREHFGRQQQQDQPARIWYAELIEKDGGRYDCRHGMGSPPFTNLLRPGGLASKLIPLLRHRLVLGDDAEVVQLGLIHAPSHERWAALSAHETGAPDGSEGAQAWHTDGGKANGLRALTVFLPLVDVMASNGATQFLLGSHDSESQPAAGDMDAATTILAPAGSAIAFDYQLWHRGLKNASSHDRPMLYAIIGTPVYDEHGNKGVPSLVGGDSPLFSGPEAAPFTPFRLESVCSSTPAAVVSRGMASSEDADAAATRARNAAHAATVRGWLEEALSFGALEMGINQLLKVRGTCDAANPPIEFADFVALDQLVVESGEAEQDARARAKRQRTAAATAAGSSSSGGGGGGGGSSSGGGGGGGADEAAAAPLEAWSACGSDAPLEGEQGSVVGVDGLEPSQARALCCAAGGYLELFDRPLLALGAFRHVYRAAPDDAAAALGVASCLRTLGRERAAARVALRFFKSRGATGGGGGGGGSGADALTSSTVDDASELLFLLADGAALIPTPKLHGSAIGQRLLASVVSFLRSGAAGAARSLLRRWLPEWLAELEEAPAAASAATAAAAAAAAPASPSLRSPGSVSVLGDLLLTGGRVPDLLCEALSGSSVGCCAQLEPYILGARRWILSRCLGHDGSGEGTSSSSPTSSPTAASGPRAPTVRAAAAVALHALFVGYCLPSDDEELKSVDAAVASLASRSDVEVCALSRSVLVLLAAIGMYRPLGEALLPRAAAALRAMPPVLIMARCVAEHCPWGYDLLAAHLLRPAARCAHAATLPAATPRLPAQSESVATFYNATLYPAWHAPETFGFLPCTIGERIRRQVPVGFTWPHEGLDRHQVLVAGSGSGHQVAQLLVTYTACDVTCIDLSANSLAYAEQQLGRCLPREMHRIRSLTADLSALPVSCDRAGNDGGNDGGEGGGGGGGGGTALGRRFHLVCCIGVLHHVHEPAAALVRLVRSSLLPGGLLQLATYSKLSVGTWRPRARALLHTMLPTVVDSTGELLRQPTSAELRSARERVALLANRGADEVRAGGDRGGDDAEVARWLLQFEEFFCDGGVRDLLFHPQETAFTLLELRDMLAAAGLVPVSVFFQDARTDERARRAYREAGGVDAAQSDLARWHALEEHDNDLFGRMHCLYARCA